jgi:hypothetical protein
VAPRSLFLRLNPVTSSDKMKLVLAIVPDPDAEAIIEKLSNSRFGVTRISSSGGFLRRG